MTEHVTQRELPNFSSVLDELGLTEENRAKAEKALTVLGGGIGDIIECADQDQQTKARNGTAVAELVDAKFFTKENVHMITNPSIKYIDGGGQVNCSFWYYMNYGTTGIKSDKNIRIDFSMALLRNVYEFFKMPVDPATGEPSDKTMLEMQQMPSERRTLLLTDFQKAQVVKVNKGIGKAFDKQRAIAKKLLGLTTTDTRPRNLKLEESLAKQEVYFAGLENSDLDVAKIVEGIKKLRVLLKTKMPRR